MGLPASSVGVNVSLETRRYAGARRRHPSPSCTGDASVGNPYARPGVTSRRTMTVRLLDFYADWCGPCKTQDPILEEVQEDLGEAFELQKVNVDEEQDVANEYQVRSLPTLIVENDEGVVDRFVGVTQKDDITAALQEAGA
ncbi:hypothetical protein JCM17823_16860 [Halorubrum gandharaense]